MADLKGQKTLLVFSQDGCGYCEEYFPELSKFTNQRDDIKVVVMQYGLSPEQNQAFKMSKGLEKATFLTATAEVMVSYKIQGTPTSILLDEEANILGTENIVKLDDLLSFVDNAGNVAIAQCAAAPERNRESQNHFYFPINSSPVIGS